MILSIDTSSLIPNVSLGSIDGLLVASYFDEVGSSTEKLPDIVFRLLKSNGHSFDSLTKVIVAIGPGSFTGIRSGISFAQGISSALTIPLLGVDVITARFLLASVNKAEKGLIYASLRANKIEHFIRSFELNDSNLIISASDIDTVNEAILSDVRGENRVIDLDTEAISKESSVGLLYSYFRKEPAISALFQSSSSSPLIPRYVKPASALTLAERNHPKI